MNNVVQCFFSLHISSSRPDVSSVTFPCMFLSLCTTMKTVVWTEVRDLLFLREERLPSENVLGKSLLLNVRSEWQMTDHFS